jgi:hypothetical protein
MRLVVPKFFAFVKNLYRYVSTQNLIVGAVDSSHPAFTDLGIDPIVTYRPSDHLNDSRRLPSIRIPKEILPNCRCGF